MPKHPWNQIAMDLMGPLPLTPRENLHIRTLHSDQGRTFKSRVLAEVVELLEIQNTRTTHYLPQSDRHVERFNRTLSAMLSTVVEPDQLDWDLHLPYVMAAYRATRHPATGFSPNFLFFVWEVTLPVDAMYGATMGVEEEGGALGPPEAGHGGGPDNSYPHCTGGLHSIGLPWTPLPRFS